MLDLSLVVTRLTSQVPLLLKVGQAADFASAANEVKIKTPAAFILPTADRGGPNILKTKVEQRLDCRFAVLLAVSNVRDMHGEAAQADLLQVRLSLFAALIGWSFVAGGFPVLFASGRMLAMRDSLVWWQDDFETSLFVRAI